MINDTQVKGLNKYMSLGNPLYIAAHKSGMSEPTARKYRKLDRLPSEQKVDHGWRTRVDPFADVWDSEVVPLLTDSPGLEAKTLFEYLREKYPGKFSSGQLRTLQRRFNLYRATYGSAQEVFFPQEHTPGKLGASDFTEMNSLGITIAGVPFDHMVYHFVLTYSNWEHVTVCFSESFESLAEGLQNALWKLGRVPQMHRSDRLTAAVNNLSKKRDFTARYQGVLDHYGIKGQRTNPNSGNENGDVEQRHHRLKRAVEQTLLLRGHRNFESRTAYEQFLSELCEKVNRDRRERLALEMEQMRELPVRRIPVYAELRGIPVSPASTIRVRNNTYSVHSRLVGKYVDVRVHADSIDVYYRRVFMTTLPRLLGKGGFHINYRHIISWLVRKPGAFPEYRYRSDLFPTSNFRIAYDLLKEQSPARADQEYLQILYLSATESEELTDRALATLVTKGILERHEEVAHLVSWLQKQEISTLPSGSVDEVNLACYDTLLTSEGGVS